MIAKQDEHPLPGYESNGLYHPTNDFDLEMERRTAEMRADPVTYLERAHKRAEAEIQAAIRAGRPIKRWH